METYNANPNFSIVLPGPCNANCKFCFWEEKPACEDYLDKLQTNLNSLDRKFDQVSLTGGEPTLSPFFHEVLQIAIDRFNKVVLTTNGINLMNVMNDVRFSTYDTTEFCVNISRHHYDEDINQKIFDTMTVPDSKEIEEIIDSLSFQGFDVNLNCVLTDELESIDEIEKMIKWAKNLGFSSIAFRNQHGSLEASEQEQLFDDHHVIHASSCPVCSSKIQKIKGMTVNWKSSVSEPDEEIDDDTIFELIFSPHGKLTSDWKGDHEVIIMENELMTESEMVDEVKRQLTSDGTEKISNHQNSCPAVYTGCRT